MVQDTGASGYRAQVVGGVKGVLGSPTNHYQKARTAFGRHPRRLRLERRLSQEALAELAGCDRGYIGLQERGVSSLSLTMALQVAAALRVAPSRLVALAAAEVGAEPAPQD